MKISMSHHGTNVMFHRRNTAVLALFLMAICQVTGDTRRRQEITLEDSRGEFESPNHGNPLPYPVNLTIDWVISSHRNRVSYVVIKEFDLWRCYHYAIKPTCERYDSLKIFMSQSKAVLGHFCNGHQPKKRHPYYGLPNQGDLVVRFTSHDTQDACRGSGFAAYIGTIPEEYYHKLFAPTTVTVVAPTTYEPSSDRSSRIPASVVAVIGVIITALIISPLIVFCWLKFRRRNNNQGTIIPGDGNNRGSVRGQPPAYSTGDYRRGDVELQPLNNTGTQPPSSGPPPSYDDPCGPQTAESPSAENHASAGAPTASGTTLELPPTYAEATGASSPNMAGEGTEAVPDGNQTQSSSGAEQSDGHGRDSDHNVHADEPARSVPENTDESTTGSEAPAEANSPPPYTQDTSGPTQPITTLVLDEGDPRDVVFV